MALTRKMLKEMGIQEDNIEKIIMAHSETVDALKKFKTDSERLASVEEELSAAKSELSEDYKSKYEELKNSFDSYRLGVEADAVKRRKEQAYKKLLTACGVIDDCVDSILKVTDLDGVELDQSGEILNADAAKDSIQRNWAAFIPKVTTTGAETATPPVKTTERIFTRDDIRKMSIREINDNYAAIIRSIGARE